jgi:geranylgeranyl transferase type-2 subunit beta
MRGLSRRDLLLRGSALCGAACAVHVAAAAAADTDAVSRSVLDFIRRCARDDGGYSPSPDPAYQGNSDTGLSDLAAVTYAAVLAKTLGAELPSPRKSIEYIRKRQQKDGSFVNFGGKMDPKAPLSVLYNTTQGVVALRALGRKPDVDPSSVIASFVEGDQYKKLPWYATSFFPLFYATLGKPFPPEQHKALAQHMAANQKDDGYIQDHVAATFHMAHFFRLVGEPTPKSDQMVRRTVHNQRSDGGWNIKAPDWDVHACFDALFILRQLGRDAPDVRAAIEKGGRWALSCRNPDGGFGHYPGKHSDMDAVYFNFGAMIQAGMVPEAKRDLPDAHTLGWGHAMQPGKVYA